jgi:hypothetical protein
VTGSSRAGVAAFTSVAPVVVSAAAALVPVPVLAQKAQSSAKQTFNHEGQFEVNVQAGFGYRAIFTYNEEFCGDLKDDGGNKSPCLGRSPFGFDIALGYGIFDRLEVFLQTRIGLESDFGQNPGSDGPVVFALSPGVRTYIGELENSRFAATLQLWVDFTDYPLFDEADIGVRNTNAYHLDLHKNYGIYFFFGEIASWKRWLRFEVELGFGAQARFP